MSPNHDRARDRGKDRTRDLAPHSGKAADMDVTRDREKDKMRELEKGRTSAKKGARQVHIIFRDKFNSAQKE